MSDGAVVIGVCVKPSVSWDIATIDGTEYLVIEAANFRIPLNFDSPSRMFFALAAPPSELGEL